MRRPHVTASANPKGGAEMLQNTLDKIKIYEIRKLPQKVNIPPELDIGGALTKDYRRHGASLVGNDDYSTKDGAT